MNNSKRHELTEYDRQCYTEELQSVAQYILDNAQKLISDLEDNRTELNLWISVSDGRVMLNKEYSQDYEFTIY